MRSWIRLFVSVSAAWVTTSAGAFAQNTGATASGNWNDPTIWTTGTVPGSSNSVFIGSTAPSGAASVATVTLTQSQSASNMTLGDGSGTSGTLNLSGNVLTITNTLTVGQNGGTGVLNEGGGSFTAAIANVESGNSLAFGANDVVSSLNLSGSSSATTAALGNVTSSVSLSTDSTLNLGANMSLTSFVIDSGSTLNMNGHDLSATSISLATNVGSASDPVTLENRGDITAGSLALGNGQVFAFNAADTTGTLGLSGGATVTTSATANVTSSVSLSTDSTLNLGANMSLTSFVIDSGSTLNMNGHDLSATSISLATNVGSASDPVTLENRGDITAGSLALGNGQVFAFNAADTTGTLGLSGGATVTTSATGNVISSVNISAGSALNLGANMSLTGNFNIQDSGSTFDAQGHALTVNELFVGSNGTAAVSVTNLGQVTLNFLDVGNSTVGSDLTLHGGDVINDSIKLVGGSVLTVQQENGIGLTLNGTSMNDLSIDPSSMDLIFNLNSTPNWDFRWKDPSGGNWISTIDSMITSGQIVISSPDGFSVVNSGGFTYIMGGVSAVPEPSSLVLACIGAAGIAIAARWRGRRTGH